MCIWLRLSNIYVYIWLSPACCYNCAFFFLLNQCDKKSKCNQVLLLAYQSFGLVLGDLSVYPLTCINVHVHYAVFLLFLFSVMYVYDISKLDKISAE